MFKPTIIALLSISIGINAYLLKKTIYIEQVLDTLITKIDTLTSTVEHKQELDNIFFETSILSPLPSLPCSPLLTYDIDITNTIPNIDI